MSFLNAAILGLVEGITEFLPISSTGHLILSSQLLGLDPTAFVKTFEIVIQLGAILAVVILFWSKLRQVKLWPKLAISFLPTGLAGLWLYPVIKSFLGSPALVVWMLALGGGFIIWFERKFVDKKQNEVVTEINWRQAFGVGVFQIASFVPGVSRAAASIVGGRILGLSRIAAVEYSFLLAVPTMAAATAYDLFKNAAAFSVADWQSLAVGFVVSALVATMAIKWLIKFVQTKTLEPFGWYRLVVALLFWLVIL